MGKLFDKVKEAMGKHPKGLPLNDRGELVPDPTPMAPPIGFRPQPSMVDIIRDQVRRVSQEAARAGFESEEQADDFDVGDEPELKSPYELDEESEVPIRVLKARADQAQLEYMEAKRDAGRRMVEDSGAGAGGAGAGAKPASGSPPEPRPSQEGGAAPGGR